MGAKGSGIDADFLTKIVIDFKRVLDLGYKIGIVVGGGNLVRGLSVAGQGGDRVTGDHMGMLATLINALALKDACQRHSIKAEVFSGLAAPSVAKSFVQGDAMKAYNDGALVVFAGGTGNPFFTTDTAATLRAVEMQADIMLKATQVDGIYDKDPRKFSDARRYDRLTHNQVLKQELGVMDLAAMALADENDLPIAVFSIHEENALSGVLTGNVNHTFVTQA